MAMNDFNISFLAGLDGTKSKAKLNQDIDAIKKSLKELELKAKLDPNQVKALENQLNSLKVNLNNVSIDKASLNNLVSQSAVNIKVENTDTLQGIINSIIDANNNLKDSTKSQNFEMMGKDIKKVQELIDSLEKVKEKEDKK